MSIPNLKVNSDRRLRVGTPEDKNLTKAVKEAYSDLKIASAKLVYSSVHEVYFVENEKQQYAFKLYREGIRTKSEIEWEADLCIHLNQIGVRVPKVIACKTGQVSTLNLNQGIRYGVMTEWSNGVKPKPSVETYMALGHSAALMHKAFDTFTLHNPKPIMDFQSEVEDQINLLKPILLKHNRWDDVTKISNKIRKYLDSHNLDRGICHNDLTLDNVHETKDGLLIFDFDSACESWRASEGQGVYQNQELRGKPYWESWLTGYRKIQPVPYGEVTAVPYMAAINNIENLAWKLGLKTTSDGILVQPSEVPKIIDTWMEWAATYLKD